MITFSRSLKVATEHLFQLYTNLLDVLFFFVCRFDESFADCFWQKKNKTRKTKFRRFRIDSMHFEFVLVNRFFFFWRLLKCTKPMNKKNMYFLNIVKPPLSKHKFHLILYFAYFARFECLLITNFFRFFYFSLLLLHLWVFVDVLKILMGKQQRNKVINSIHTVTKWLHTYAMSHFFLLIL